MYQIKESDELGVPRAEVAEAVRVGLVVNRGAESAIPKYTRDLLGKAMTETASQHDIWQTNGKRNDRGGNKDDAR